MQIIKQNPVMSILLILIIIITTTNFSQHILIRNIMGFLMVCLIIKGLKLRTHPMKILLLSLIIVLILEVVGNVLCKNVERFETMDDLVETLEEIQKKVDEKEKKNPKKSKSDNDLRESDGNDISLNDVDSIDVDSNENSNNSYNKKEGDLSNKKIDNKNYTPQKAQQETFKLLNTVRELKETMEELAPSLSTAKDVLGMYKQIKI
jgi:hypothetical protein|tara:strand:+ start:440 stop:1057 length:618 start_codon:yes stop_codon:yes gene_type:complete